MDKELTNIPDKIFIVIQDGNAELAYAPSKWRPVTYHIDLDVPFDVSVEEFVHSSDYRAILEAMADQPISDQEVLCLLAEYADVLEPDEIFSADEFLYNVMQPLLLGYALKETQ